MVLFNFFKEMNNSLNTTLNQMFVTSISFFKKKGEQLLAFSCRSLGTPKHAWITPNEEEYDIVCIPDFFCMLYYAKVIFHFLPIVMGSYFAKDPENLLLWLPLTSCVAFSFGCRWLAARPMFDLRAEDDSYYDTVRPQHNLYEAINDFVWGCLWIWLGWGILTLCIFKSNAFANAELGYAANYEPATALKFEEIFRPEIVNWVMERLPYNPAGYERSIDTNLMYKRVTVAVFGYLAIKMGVRELCTSINLRAIRMHRVRRYAQFDKVHTRREEATNEQILALIRFVYKKYRTKILYWVFVVCFWWVYVWAAYFVWVKILSPWF